MFSKIVFLFTALATINATAILQNVAFANTGDSLVTRDMKGLNFGFTSDIATKDARTSHREVGSAIPVVTKAVVAAPVAVGYGGIGYGAGFAGHGYGTGIGALGYGVGHGVGLGYGVAHGVGLGYGVGPGVGLGYGIGHGVGHGYGAGIDGFRYGGAGFYGAGRGVGLGYGAGIGGLRYGGAGFYGAGHGVGLLGAGIGFGNGFLH